MQKKKDGTNKGYQLKQAIKIIDGEKFWSKKSKFFLIPKETEITLPKLTKFTVVLLSVKARKLLYSKTKSRFNPGLKLPKNMEYRYL